MPSNYSFTENGVVYNFDNVFVPAEFFIPSNLWTWGRNNSGQLGNNASFSIDISTPITTFAGGNNWKSIASGNAHTIAIKTDGSLWNWGYNQHGQLGDNATVFRSTPVTTFAGGNNWKSIAGGVTHTVAIKTDGTLWTWGYGLFGQLGNNDVNNKITPVTTFAGSNTWNAIKCGNSYTIAIKTDGTLWTWGRNYYGQLGTNSGGVGQTIVTPVTTFAGGTNWKTVSCGDEHAIAIKTDGTLWTWGRNNNGQLGINDTTDRFTPVTTFAGENNWKLIAGGVAHTVAIKTDGTLWTWGFNNAGQLGNDGISSKSTPVTTFSGGNNWKYISASTFTASIKTDGTLWVWGNNLSGALGINNTSAKDTPVTTFLGGSNWKDVSCGNIHSVAIKYQ